MRSSSSLSGPLLALLLVAPSVQAGQAQWEVLELSPDDAVALAIDHNVGLQAASYGPLLAEAEQSAARTAWTPEILLRAAAIDSRTPSSSLFLGGLSSGEAVAVTSRGSSFELSISQRLASGSSFRVGWLAERGESNDLFANFDPEYRAGFSASFVQSLVRGRGRDPAGARIAVERVRREVADIDLVAATARTRHQALYAYWQWWHAQDLLAVQRQSLELARALLRENRERIARGAMAAVDAIEAEAEVARRTEAILVGQKTAAVAERLLRAMIFDPAEPGFERPLRRAPGSSTAVSEVGREPAAVEALVQSAIARRRDLEVVRQGIAIDSIEIRQLRNAALPDVVLELAYRAEGLGGDQLIRGPGFPGPIVGTSSRDFSAAAADALSGDFPTWSAQMTVRQPLGRGRSRAESLAASVRQEQRRALLRAAEVAVTTEVIGVSLDVTANRERLRSTREAVILTERRLEGEQRKFEAGLSTSFFVFQAQRDLAAAREAELRSQLDYRLSTVDLETVRAVPLRSEIPVSER